MLRVPEGESVTATGSSKKIAKNIAAKLMLDKLDKKKTDDVKNHEEEEEDQVSVEHFTYTDLPIVSSSV